MDLKKSLSAKAAQAARLIPGIGSYQEKEKFRELDRRVRNHIVSVLEKYRSQINGLKARLSRELKLDLLDDLDRLVRKMNQLADTVKFAAAGCSPLFDRVTLDKERLEEIFHFDQSLDKELALMEAQVGMVIASPDSDRIRSIQELEVVLARLEERVGNREKLLKAVK